MELFCKVKEPFLRRCFENIIVWPHHPNEVFVRESPFLPTLPVFSGMDLVGCFVLIDVGDCAGIPCSFILGKHSNFKINQYAKKVLEHVHGSRVTSHATMPERLAISVTKLKFS